MLLLFVISFINRKMSLENGVLFLFHFCVLFVFIPFLRSVFQKPADQVNEWFFNVQFVVTFCEQKGKGATLLRFYPFIPKIKN